MNKYPAETVRKLLETDAVSEPTRRALKARWQAADNYQAKFFGEKEFGILAAICAQLIPQTEVDCAAFVDLNFSENRSDGWRYDRLPNDAETFRSGLRGVDETARAKFSADFIELSGARRDEVLTDVQRGEAAGDAWRTLDAKLFFEELLAQIVEVYYAHPLAQERIGYVGMADAPGWTRLGLNELEPREPRELD